MGQERLFTIDYNICNTEADRATLYKLCPYLPSGLFENLYACVGMCFSEVIAETPEQALDQALYRLSEQIEENFPDIKLEDSNCCVLYNREKFEVYISSLYYDCMYIIKLTDFEVCSLRRW